MFVQFIKDPKRSLLVDDLDIIYVELLMDSFDFLSLQQIND